MSNEETPEQLINRFKHTFEEGKLGDIEGVVVSVGDIKKIIGYADKIKFEGTEEITDFLIKDMEAKIEVLEKDSKNMESRIEAVEKENYLLTRQLLEYKKTTLEVSEMLRGLP